MWRVGLLLCCAVGCSGLESSPVATVIGFPIDNGEVDSLSVTGLTLVPAYSRTILDYYVRCADGDNTIDVSVTSAGRTLIHTYTLVPNDAVQVADYWIRCLPPDFPVIGVTTHPELGAPTPGYYLVNSGPYVAALDTNGTPVWYEPTTSGGDVDSLQPNVISYLPNAEYPFAIDDAPNFQIADLAAGTSTTLTSPDAPTNEHELQRLANGDRKSVV